MVDGATWTLDVTYQTGQSGGAGDTTCVIHNRDVFELTITETDSRSAPTAFVGTWVQENSLDLAASTGQVDLYCGEAWQLIDEWSLVSTG